jgi:hypothetical protein
MRYLLLIPLALLTLPVWPQPETLLFAVTATQGDGTVCAAAKVGGATPVLVVRCTPGDGEASLSASVWKAPTATTPQSFPVGYGDVFCLVSLQPPNSLAWRCSTNTYVNGKVTGQTGTTGTAQWP